MLHLVWFSSCVALFYSNGQRDLQYPLYNPILRAFGPSCGEQHLREAQGHWLWAHDGVSNRRGPGIVLRLHWLMSSFFALSFVFQIAASMLDYCGVYPYEENVRKYGTHWMRFVSIPLCLGDDCRDWPAAGHYGPMDACGTFALT